MNGTVAILIAIFGSWGTVLALVLGQGRAIKKDLGYRITATDQSVKDARQEAKADVQRLAGSIADARQEAKADVQRLEGSIADARQEAKADNQRLEAAIVDARREAKEDNQAARREAKEDNRRLEATITAAYEKFDDRIYALAAGLRPLIEAAQNPAAS